MRYRLLDTPIEPFAIIEEDDGRLGTTFVSGPGDRRLKRGRRDETLRPELAGLFAQYFAGQAVEFACVPTPDGPPFFRACWEAARRIARGEVRTYAQLAAMAGAGAGAARAAGQAMRRNPLGIIIPCHRVIGADGRLGGFGGSTDPTGDALTLKRRLLAFEGALTDGEPPEAARAGRPSDGAVLFDETGAR
ncbi:MAG: methylated-DNA--[protein]-cysteine S-methyltransferase [Planctomycetota bacterium]|nr:methylated-DNA--[protein]-cysteine S-methyltransferase [Planctomycetota bacterium]